MNKLGYNFKINICNPSLTNIWENPWILDIPLAKKPTFLNMQEPFESLLLGDLTTNGCWNFPAIEAFLGPNFDLD